MSHGISPGKNLRAARCESGRSIEDISRETHIPEDAIRKLEEEPLSRFPDPEYGRIFLAQYCDYLGLSSAAYPDPLDATKDLSEISTGGRHEPHRLTRVEIADNRPTPGKSSSPGRGLLRSRDQYEGEMRETSVSSGRNRQPVIVFSITSILIACSLFAYMKLSGELDQGEASALQKPEDALGAIGGISLQAPRNPVFSNVPRALPVSPEDTRSPDGGGLSEAPRVDNLSVSALSPLVTTLEELSMESPPPRAVIVDE